MKANQTNSKSLFILLLFLSGALAIPATSFGQWSNNANGTHSTPSNGSHVGINNSFPQTYLNVGGTRDVSLTSHGLAVFGSTSSTNIGIDQNEIQARNNGNYSGLWMQNDGGELRIHQNVGGTSTFAIKDNGYVGIGNLYPETHLNVMAGQEAALGAVGSNTHGYLMLGRSYSTNLVMDTDEIQARSNGGSSRLFMNPAGGDLQFSDKLGLHLGGSVVIGRNFQYSGGAKGLYNGAVAIMSYESDGDIAFRGGSAAGAGQAISYNPANSLFIQNDGKVGVGVDDIGPDFEFVVEGKIGAREIEVTTASWADYVFEEDYALMPLEEVASYVQANKHLPNIPAAAEVEANGLALGEMQVKMMEKIEELTLYIIDLDQEVKQLKSENATLKTTLPTSAR